MHPGEKIKFDVRFEGAGANQFDNLSLYFAITSGARKDQPSFQNGFYGPVANRGENGVFHVEATIPEGVTSGEWGVYINAHIKDTAIAIQYEPQSTGIKSITIDDPKKFEIPKIVVIDKR